MFPLYSDRPLTRFPFVTIFLIVVNGIVFWFQFTSTGSVGHSVTLYGMIPYNLFHGGVLAIPGNFPTWTTLFSSMFMHGGFLHLGANMLYLWVFGRNVEDDFGHIRFLIFYLIAGVLATLAFAFAFPISTVPLVGASGAIAGVLGAYFLRFPGSRIFCLIVFFFFVRIIPLPAFFILGLWFAIQLGACMSSISAAAGAAGVGGIAWISHIAGFVFGMIWTIFELRRRYYMRRSQY